MKAAKSSRADGPMAILFDEKFSVYLNSLKLRNTFQKKCNQTFFSQLTLILLNHTSFFEVAKPKVDI
jgi:hypothetical protein